MSSPWPIMRTFSGRRWATPQNPVISAIGPFPNTGQTVTGPILGMVQSVEIIPATFGFNPIPLHETLRAFLEENLRVVGVSGGQVSFKLVPSAIGSMYMLLFGIAASQSPTKWSFLIRVTISEGQFSFTPGGLNNGNLFDLNGGDTLTKNFS